MALMRAGQEPSDHKIQLLHRFSDDRFPSLSTSIWLAQVWDVMR